MKYTLEIDPDMKPYMLEVFSDITEPDSAEEFIFSKTPINLSIEEINSLSPNWHKVEIRYRGELVARLTKN